MRMLQPFSESDMAIRYRLMHVFLREIPEVAVLDADQRRELLRRIPFAVKTRLLLVPLALATLTALVVQLEISDGLFGGAGHFISVTVGFVAGGLVAIGTRIYMVRQIRHGIRSMLRRAAVRGDVVVCLSCGYDLSAASHNSCPECGKSAQPNKN